MSKYNKVEKNWYELSHSHGFVKGDRTEKDGTSYIIKILEANEEQDGASTIGYSTKYIELGAVRTKTGKRIFGFDCTITARGLEYSDLPSSISSETRRKLTKVAGYVKWELNMGTVGSISPSETELKANLLGVAMRIMKLDPNTPVKDIKVTDGEVVTVKVQAVKTS